MQVFTDTTGHRSDTMNDELTICERYETYLAAIAELDRVYYLNKTATTADRAAYAARQEEREGIHIRLLAELSLIRTKKPPARASLSIRMDEAPTSASVCTLLHELRNDLTAVLCRCETLVEDLSKGRNAANDAASLLELAKRMTRRLHEPSACDTAQHPCKPLPTPSERDPANSCSSFASPSRTA